MFRPTRLAATTAAVLIPITVASGSGAPPLPVSATFGPAVPSGQTAVAAPVPGAGTTWTAPSVSSGSVTSRPALASSGKVDATDIPMVALAAYQRAAAVIAAVPGDCGLRWELLAAIGQVESDHGRVGGATLNADGTSSPAVRGPVLDGRGSFAAIADTDAGLYDGDARWDRAIGPMQFLPSTWSVVGVDADGDGVRSADDLDDAALGAAVYLCSGDEDLATTAGARAAVLRYNHSAEYATRVLAVARAYEQGRAATATSVEALIARGHPATTNVAVVEHPPTDHGGVATGVFVHPHHASGHQPGKPTRPHPTPAEPTPTPEPEPTDPTEPTEPTDPTPTDPTPTPEPEPTTVTLTGVLAVCADDAAAWCLDDTTLDLGDDASLAAVAADDLDGDGVVETNREEISGLVGTQVTLVVVADTTPARVVSVNGTAYGEAASADTPGS